jgi:hypothetical protein
MCRRKQQQVEQQIMELGMDSLQERLEDAAQTPAKPPYRLATLIQVTQPLYCICLTKHTDVS